MEPLAIVRKWVAPYVGESGKNASDPSVLEDINEARRIIYPVGDWKDTIESVILPVYLGTITLPAWAETIRKAWVFRGQNNRHASDMDIQHQWYSPVPDNTIRSVCGHELTLIDMGQRYASFQPYDKNFRLKVISADDSDSGTQITFHAISEYGARVLLTRTLGKAWTPIVSEPAADIWIKAFSYCVKPKTKDRVFVYISDIIRGTESLCAIYEAGDVNPQYRRYRVGLRTTNVVARVKKRFVELTDDRQVVDIHTDALVHLLQGVTCRRNRDAAGYATAVKAAKNFLDAEINSLAPIKTHYMKMAPMYRDTNLGFSDCDIR